MMGYVPRKAEDQIWNQPKRQKYDVVGHKDGRSCRSEEYFDIKWEDAEFGVFPVVFLP